MGVPKTETIVRTSAKESENVEVEVEEGVIIRKDLQKPRFVSYLWDTFDKPPEERRLLCKLDAAILSFSCIGYFVKALDQVNVNSAFVSGMKEDLGLYQNQLNYIQAAWAIGYMLGQLPSNIILTRTRPRYWLPSLEVIWAILTLALSKCNSPYQFYVIRFFVGLAESGYYPGIQYIVGSWYRRDELGKRSCIVQICSSIGSMVSGYLMAGVYHLGGVGGYKGWQWLFLVDGLISLPMALSGYFIVPDVPEITKSWYLTEKEIALARRRMELEGRKPRAKYTKEKIKRILSSWHVYLVGLLYLAFSNGSSGGQPVFQQFLRHSTHPKYSVEQINSYPTASSAVQIVMIIVYAWLSDTVLRGRRWPPLVFGGTINVICYVSLAIWKIPTWWKWTCFITLGAGHAVGGLFMAWANEICEDDSEERAITLAAMHEVAYIVQIWLPLIVWQQVDAPRYHKGYITASVMSVTMIVMCLVVRVLHNRELARKRIQQVVVGEQGEGQGQEEAQGSEGRELHQTQTQNQEKQKEEKETKHTQPKPIDSQLNLIKTKTLSSPSATTSARDRDAHRDIVPRTPTSAETEAETEIEIEEVRPSKIC
ncbi:hypothetical protein VTN77DRAFT_3338 [Rasamsonia byssochlamydoides]|uniref:uncharacterized protein n=1 Tax=Rasamsonia byssochlamydoides TaxID=89139 RepID=UPI003742923E